MANDMDGRWQTSPRSNAEPPFSIFGFLLSHQPFAVQAREHENESREWKVEEPLSLAGKGWW